ncbi:hypothetical protein GCM10009772_45600 [Pseudonocardia alni subsp. carboxydivorans]|uniref:Uncharacterized protein n=1 Tax=Pseudonocardia alni subsp. carboxydivorans TaxID=415010 RepID=A0ABU9AFL4_PSEA5
MRDRPVGPGEAAREPDGAVREVPATSAARGAHPTGHASRVDGPVHETYLVGPRDTGDAAARRTGIGWPVFTTRPG